MIHFNDGGAVSIVRFSIDIHDLPGWLETGIENYPNTPCVEVLGAELVSEDFPEDLTIEFVGQVCHWGGVDRVRGKVLNGNDSGQIAEVFRLAHAATQADNLSGAMQCMIDLHGLGVSVASKHLKFLDPTRHVVLDSIISKILGYSPTVWGYSRFVADCRTILNQVHEQRIVRNDGDEFRIADVEMAIYTELKARLEEFD